MISAILYVAANQFIFQRPVGRVWNGQTGLINHNSFSYLECRNIQTKSVETQASKIWTWGDYEVDTACLSEVKLTDSNQIAISLPNKEITYHLYYSSTQANTALLAWEPIYSHLLQH